MSDVTEDELASIITRAVYPHWNTKSYRLRIPHQRAAKAILERFDLRKFVPTTDTGSVT